MLPVGPAAAQRESAERELERAKKRVHALRHVAEQLQELGRREMAQELRHEAAELAARLERHLAERERARAERGETEREVARRQLTVMRYAVEALVEADKHDAADLIERAMHARELALEGRRDEEAAHIRETAPKRGQQAELLGLAAELLQDAGRTERATVVGRLARELAGRREPSHRGDKEREVAIQQLEHMQLGLHALLEADRKDAAELLEHAIHARKLALEGRRDEEAIHIRKSAPNRGQLAELMLLAERIYDEMGHERKAEMVGRLARELAPKRGRRPAEHSAREGHEQAEHLEAAMQRIERLEGRLHELMEAMEALQAELHKLKRKLD